MPSRRSRIDARPNALSVAVSARSVAGRPYLDLTVSNPTRSGIACDHAAIAAALAASAGEPYEPSSFGRLDARRSVSALWESRGIDVSPERVVLTTSTSEAYSYLFKLLCDPGDEILVPSPSYPLFEHLMRYEGVNPVSYWIEYDGAFHLDLSSVQARVSPRTRAVVTVTPNNPTGSILKRSELEGLCALGLPIISDEVFGDYRIAPAPGAMRTVLEAKDALVFALDGLSKTAALPQMKLAWIAIGGPEARVTEHVEALEHIADTFLSPSGPVQHALPSLLSASRVSSAAIQHRIEHNDAVLRDICRGKAITVLPVEGGWYAVLRLPAVRSEEAWVLGLLEECDVLVQPGWFFDFASEAFVVVSLLTPEAELEEGARRLCSHVTGAS